MKKRSANSKTRNVITLSASALLLFCLVFSLCGCGSVVRGIVDHKEKLFPMPVPESLQENLKEAQSLGPSDVTLITVVRATVGGVDSYYVNDQAGIATYLSLIDNLKLTRASQTSVQDDGVSIYLHQGNKKINLRFEGDSLVNSKEGAICEGLDVLKGRVDIDVKKR